jgi:hypothetical protein
VTGGLSAMVASSASAGTYYWCRPMKKGEYTSSTCATRSKPKKGKFEKVPVEPCVAQNKGDYTNDTCTTLSAKPHKGTFEKTFSRGYLSTSGAVTLAPPDYGAGAVKCKASTDQAEITGPTTDVDRITFTGCEFESLPCESAGPESTPSGKSGVIITNLLDSKLIDYANKAGGYLSEGPVLGEVWQELYSAEHQPWLAEFNCDGVVFLRIDGAISGAYTFGSLNHLSITAGVLFEKDKGEQALAAQVAVAPTPPPPWIGGPLFPTSGNGSGNVEPLLGAPAFLEAGLIDITTEVPIEVRS